MITLYQAFNGDEEGEAYKLPIWGVMTSIGQLLDGQITDNDFIVHYSLNTLQQLQFAEAKNTIFNDITSVVTSLMMVGIDQTNAVRVAHSVIGNEYQQTLIRAERGLIDESEFNSALGIQTTELPPLN